MSQERGVPSRWSEAAPALTASFVHQALERAIRGVGPLTPATATADAHVRAAGEDRERAVRDLIETHVRLAAGQGFLTNLGGLVTMPVTAPANITGLALVQCRLVAAILHLRGYDLDDRRVRNGLLVALLGEDHVSSLLDRKRLPGTPMAIATAPVHDPHLDTVLANEVASELLTRVAGKKLAGTVGRRVPFVGGLVGAGSDGYTTWRIGRYADAEFLPRARR